MKKIKSTLLVVVFASISACGGGAATNETPKKAASLGGTVAGFPSGLFLFLSNNESETIGVSGDGEFYFNRRVNEGEAYAVSVLGEPSGIACEVLNGSGNVAHGTEAVTSISVVCKRAFSTGVRFNVGITISGLSPGNSISFSNNGKGTLTAAYNGLFVFPDAYYTNTVYAGHAGGYDVAIQTNPTGQRCLLTNASGEISSTAQNNFVHVFVDCK